MSQLRRVCADAHLFRFPDYRLLTTLFADALSTVPTCCELELGHVRGDALNGIADHRHCTLAYTSAGSYYWILWDNTGVMEIVCRPLCPIADPRDYRAFLDDDVEPCGLPDHHPGAHSFDLDYARCGELDPDLAAPLRPGRHPGRLDAGGRA